MKEFYYNIGDIIKDDKRNLEILEQKRLHTKKTSKNNPTTEKWYLCKCNKCKCDDVLINESNLKRDRGCPICHGSQVRFGINDITTTDSWCIDYFQGGIEEAKIYTKGSNKKLFFKCPDCGKIKKTPMLINILIQQHGLTCECNKKHRSYPEILLEGFLMQFGINYIPQTSSSILKWIRGKKRYDFYLPDYNCIIETHGIQHYEDVWFSEISYEIENDRVKREIALSNGIEHYFELDCRTSKFDYIIKSIMNSNLIGVLNINIENLNKEKLKEYSSLNLTYEICNDYNKNLTKNEIAIKYNISIDTVKKRLIYGDEIGLCKYIYKKKPVICDGVVYKTITDCAKSFNIKNSTMSCWLSGSRSIPEKFIKLGLGYYQ